MRISGKHARHITTADTNVQLVYDLDMSVTSTTGEASLVYLVLLEAQIQLVMEERLNLNWLAVEFLIQKTDVFILIKKIQILILKAHFFLLSMIILLITT